MNRSPAHLSGLIRPRAFMMEARFYQSRDSIGSVDGSWIAEHYEWHKGDRVSFGRVRLADRQAAEDFVRSCGMLPRLIGRHIGKRRDESALDCRDYIKSLCQRSAVSQLLEA